MPSARTPISASSCSRPRLPMPRSTKQGRPANARSATCSQSLSVEDAREAYRAIRHARPGGLGAAPAHDVASEPEITLLEAMRAAEARDRIAWNYSHDFADIFSLGVPTLEQGAERWAVPSFAVTGVYLAFLASLPDTLIARKFGAAKAAEVQAEARDVQASFRQSADWTWRPAPHGLRHQIEGLRTESRHERRPDCCQPVRVQPAGPGNQPLSSGKIRAFRRTIDLPILGSPDYLHPA